MHRLRRLIKRKFFPHYSSSLVLQLLYPFRSLVLFQSSLRNRFPGFILFYSLSYHCLQVLFFHFHLQERNKHSLPRSGTSSNGLKMKRIMRKFFCSLTKNSASLSMTSESTFRSYRKILMTMMCKARNNISRILQNQKH